MFLYGLCRCLFIGVRHCKNRVAPLIKRARTIHRPLMFCKGHRLFLPSSPSVLVGDLSFRKHERTATTDSRLRPSGMTTQLKCFFVVIPEGFYPGSVVAFSFVRGIAKSVWRQLIKRVRKSGGPQGLEGRSVLFAEKEILPVLIKKRFKHFYGNKCGNDIGTRRRQKHARKA